MTDPIELLEEAGADIEEFENNLLNLESKNALNILENEVIPKTNKVIESLSEMDIKNDDLKKFNQSLIDTIVVETEKYEELIKHFNTILNENSAEAIRTLDYDNMAEKLYTYNEKILENSQSVDAYFNTLIEEYGDAELNEEDLFMVSGDLEIDTINEATNEMLVLFAKGVIEDIDAESPPEEQVRGEETEDEEVANKPDDSLSKHSDTEIDFQGVIEIKDGFKINGETNLLLGSILDVTVFHLGTENPYIDEEMTVDDDGLFATNLELPKDDLTGIPIEIGIGYYPEEADKEARELYGEEGENLTGPFAAKYTSIKRTRTGAFAYSYIDLENGNKESLITPDWNEADDYGELDIWMEAEKIEENEKYYDIYMKSNLLDLARVKATVENPGYDMAGFTSATKVKSDGSFRFQIEKPDIDNKESTVIIEAFSDSAIEIEEVYGENGGNFEGDLVKDTRKGKKIEFKLPLEN